MEIEQVKLTRPEDFESIAAALEDSYFAHRRIQHISNRLMPSRDEIYGIIEHLFTLLFPGFFGRQDLTAENVGRHVRDQLEDVSIRLYRQIYQCFTARKHDDANLQRHAWLITNLFLDTLPRVRDMLEHDVIAAFKGDPAAQDTDEIIFSYPSTIAIGTYRLAHELYSLQVPLMPRIMTERAHSLTGIDIHPGAKIGKGFFIDHGTGVVIGATTVIGNNCKLYQGVTLGAISFPHDDEGYIVRGQKRHPTLEDEVIVYSNASILGDVTIGTRSTIGGSVFLTQSVPPGSLVAMKPSDLKFKSNCGFLGRGHVADYQI